MAEGEDIIADRLREDRIAAPRQRRAGALDGACARGLSARMRIHVECRSEKGADPLRFVLGDHTVEVEDLLDRWYGDDADYFRVRGRDGHLYVLKHFRGHEGWELTSRLTACSTPRA